MCVVRREPAADASPGLLALGALLVLAGAVSASASAQEGLIARLGVERARATLEGASDPDARRAAARFLGRHGSAERAAEALAAAIVVETDRDVRIEIADALARRGTPLASEAIAERLAGAPEGERHALLRALGAAADARALEALALELGTVADGPLAADMLVAAGPSARTVLVTALLDPGRRAPALDALGRLGEPAAADDVSAYLHDEDAPVRASAARALARLGDPGAVLPGALAEADDALAGVILRALAGTPAPAPMAALTQLAHARLGSSEPSTRAGALLFLATHAPAGAIEPLLRSLEDVPEVRTATRSALGLSDDAALVPVARALVERSERGTAPFDVGIDFLARAAGGAGIEALVDLGASPSALALALRRAPSAAAWSRGYDALVARSGGSSVEIFSTLAGVPRGPSVSDASDPLERAAAAARAWLSPRGDAALLAEALAREDDARAFSWLARAAAAHGVPLPAGLLLAWLDRPDRAADALALVPGAMGAASAADARRLRRAVSRAVLSTDARERATAAQALGALGATESAAALEALVADASETVRIAAARSLAVLAPERAVEVVSAAARAAHDASSAGRLRDALKPAGAADVLVVRVAAAPGAPTSPWLELRTCDGTWLRLPALADGLVVVPAVRCAEVDADLVLGP